MKETECITWKVWTTTQKKCCINPSRSQSTWALTWGASSITTFSTRSTSLLEKYLGSTTVPCLCLYGPHTRTKDYKDTMGYGQFTPPCHQKTEKWKMSQNSGSVFGLWNWLITKIQWPSRRWNSCNFLDAKQRAQSATPPPAPRAAAIWSSIATKSKAGCLL